MHDFKVAVRSDVEARQIAGNIFDTTEPLTPWQTHRKYGERATSETWIEEGKSQMGLAQMKTDHFLANAALFQSAILAYNTLRWMALMSNNNN